MKRSIMILACLISLAVVAQNVSTVNITVKGTRNKEVRIDGTVYQVNTDASSTTAVNLPIQITNLSTGQHTIEIVRTNRYNTSNTTGNKTFFNLRSGYDLNITVNNDGSVQTSETRIRRNLGNQTRNRTPMSDASFDALVKNIQYQRTAAKVTAITTAFNTPSNYFTTAQAMELIGLVNSQSSRLSLAKASYKTITDPANFSQQLNDLILTQAGRRELATYVRTYDNNNPRSGTNNPNYPQVAMSDANFNSLYTRINNEWSASVKLTSLTTEFNSSTTYFTTAQTRQLIQLVSDENSRLQLAKLAYNNVVDPANYYNQLYSLFISTSSRNEFDAFVRANGNPSSPTRIAMTDASFNSLYTRISNEWGLGVKMSSLTNEFNNSNNYFTAAQTRQLIQLVSDENNRLQLAKLGYDNAVDQENYYNQLYTLLSSTSSRNELDAYVKANSSSTSYPTYPTRIAMTDANFNNLYSNISNQWGLGVKMSSLTTEFNNSNNNFTTAQARQLIQLVSDEDNRLQLAKSSYDNIVDPENFSRLYDVLASQSKRNELAEYVRAYSYNR